MGYRTHQRSRDGPKRAVESEQNHPSRIARKLLLLPKNLCERRSVPRPLTHDPPNHPLEKPLRKTHLKALLNQLPCITQ